MKIKRSMFSIVTLCAALILLLMVTSCGRSGDDDIQNGEIKTEPIVERDNERPPTIKTNESEQEESGELMSPEVKAIVDKARAIKNWKYRKGTAEFIICGETIKIFEPTHPSFKGNTFILNTVTKELREYRCEKTSCKIVDNSTKYEQVYQKTPADYLNEESFVDATIANYAAEVNNRKALPVEVEFQNQKKVYWFDSWVNGGVLLKIEYKNIKTGATLETVSFDIIESNPKNIKDYECEIDTATA